MNAHPLQLSHVNAMAVGFGIASSIGSAGVHSDTAADWIHYCVKAAMEARAAVLDNPPEVSEEVGPTEQLLRDLGLEDEYGRPTKNAAGFAYTTGRDGTPEPRAVAGPALIAAANHAAAVAFRCCLPQLTNRRRVQAYIACIASGVGHGFIVAKDVNPLLYAAQLSLSAYPKRRANSARKAA